MKNFFLAALLSTIMTCAWAASPAGTVNNTPTNGFDQAADSVGIGSQSYNPHLSSSSIKTAPNDNADDVLQDGISNPDPNSPDNVSSASS